MHTKITAGFMTGLINNRSHCNQQKESQKQKRKSKNSNTRKHRHKANSKSVPSMLPQDNLPGNPVT